MPCNLEKLCRHTLTVLFKLFITFKQKKHDNKNKKHFSSPANFLIGCRLRYDLQCPIVHPAAGSLWRSAQNRTDGLCHTQRGCGNVYIVPNRNGRRGKVPDAFRFLDCQKERHPNHDRFCWRQITGLSNVRIYPTHCMYARSWHFSNNTNNNTWLTF